MTVNSSLRNLAFSSATFFIRKVSLIKNPTKAIIEIVSIIDTVRATLLSIGLNNVTANETTEINTEIIAIIIDTPPIIPVKLE